MDFEVNYPLLVTGYWLLPVMDFLAYIIVILAAGGLSWLVYWIWQKREKGHWGTMLGMSLYLVRVPQRGEEGDKNTPPEEIIGGAEQLYAAFSDLKIGTFWHRFIYGRPRAVVEISNITDQKEIAFYIAVPKRKGEEAKKKIQGTYPEAEVEKQDSDYNIFHKQGKEAGVYMKLERNSFFPLKTYKELKVDPLSQVTNALSKLGQAEGAAVQIVFRSTTKTFEARIKEVTSRMKKGDSFSKARKETGVVSAILKELTSFFSPTKSKFQKEAETEKEPVTVDEDTIEALQLKIAKTNFEADIRLLASAENVSRAESILSQLTGAFGQFSSTKNSFKPVSVKGRALEKLVAEFSFRRFNSKQKIILNTEELASLCHFSHQKLKTPGIKGLKTKRVAPPSELPDEGVLLLGKTIYRGEEKDAYISSRQDRRRHFYLVGQTGTGKTAFLQEQIRQDIEAGKGVGVVDPHGDLIESTLANIPKERVEDVVLFEPFYTKRPCGLNMLEYDTPEQKDFAVQEMIAIFHKLFPPEIIGPMFEHYMRNAMLALMADRENPGTLVEIPRMFTDEDFMEEKLKRVKDPVVKNFWLKEWKKTTGQTRSDMLGYVVSKVGRFIENKMMRNIIGQRHSSFDLGKVMDEGRIFLANLSKGKTGEVNASLLGLILVTKLQMGAMKRADKAVEERKDFYLYVDEFQNFTTDSIATILSEARKYRLNLIVAHQYISQLEEKIRDAVFGNVGSLAAMRVGAEDGEILETQFEPEFTKQDLINLPNFNVILKLMIEGHISSPFRMKTYPPKQGHPQIVESIKKVSYLKYGRPQEDVENQIKKRAKLS